MMLGQSCFIPGTATEEGSDGRQKDCGERSRRPIRECQSILLRHSSNEGCYGFWVDVTVASDVLSTPQLSFAHEGGSGTPVPDLSIEIDNLDEVYQRALAAGFPIEYGPVTEPWGVRRFYTRDPVGRLVNILSHGQPR
jgi:hypothetical protein